MNVARTMASERARGCCCACFVFALQWKPLIIVGRYRRAFSRAWTSLPLTSRVVRSGATSLDEEALALLRRAQPFPAPPRELGAITWT